MKGLVQQQSRVKLVSAQAFFLLMVSSSGAMAAAQAAAGNLTTDTQALRALLASMKYMAPRLSWPSNVSACVWRGVKCNPSTNRVESLRLPGVGLVGQIPYGILGNLTELRILSLHSNKLSGPLPSDLTNCTQIRSLYLQKNAFSGSLPSFLPGFPPLIRLNLALNNFSGTIPSSYSVFHRLGTLYLQNNSLSGTLPDFVSSLPNLTQFSVANNSLNGSVSATFQKKFDLPAFEGNKFCGKPLFAACPEIVVAPTPAPSEAVSRRSKRHIMAGYIAAIVVGAVAFVFFIIACCVVWCMRRQEWSTAHSARGRRATESGGVDVTEKVMEAGGKAEDFSSAAEMERNKLVFFEGGQSTFDLEDLLRASAEVLGKGNMGTAYKATLEDGSTVVVKRLKDVSVGRKEFEQYMATLGCLRHRHLVPLRAYYYSKDEKLLLFEYMPLGSLSALIHGNKVGSSRMALDWDTRVRIATGAARGVAFLHEQQGTTSKLSTHGNIKSSNVLLRGNYHASVSDFALAPLFGSSQLQLLSTRTMSGYRAPEVVETRKITQKADVYSFGVLLLELLTGKAPMQTSNEEGIDLPRWVQSVVREEWTAEVFDAQLMRFPNIEEEMVQVLQIAMSCVAGSPDQRPTMSQVVKMIEDVRAFETDDNNNNRLSSSDKSKESNGHTPQRTEPSTPARVTP